tara:strand:+ start:155 stop:859 length:705 start_codon:yes stop_codon:yes gene_type:complete
MKVNPYILLSLIFLALSLTMKSIPQLDIQLLKFFNTLMFNKTFFSYFTEIGNGLVCLAITVPLLSIVSSKTQLNNVKVQTLVFVGLGVGLIVKSLKELTSLFAVRPGFYEFEDVTYLEPVYLYSSFPSGHAATIFSLFFVWVSLAFRNTKISHSNLIITILLIFALLVSLSRVIVAAHWLSDVLGSIALAFVALNAIRFKVLKNILFESKVAKFSSFFLIGAAWTYIISTGSIY